jgi:hypothetical protein
MTGPPGSVGPGATGVTGPTGPAGAGASALTWNDAQATSPAGNVSTTEKAMGLGSSFSISPVNTGVVLVLMSGVALNSSAAGDGVTITGRHGAGTPPANGDTSGLGTAFSVPQHFVASTTAGQQGFCLHGVIFGLTVGAVTWFDLSIVAVTGGGATIKDVQFSVVEISNG